MKAQQQDGRCRGAMLPRGCAQYRGADVDRRVADAEQITRDDAVGGHEDDAGGMDELFRLRIEPIAEPDCVGDRLYAPWRRPSDNAK